MKKLFIVCIAVASCGLSLAQEMGHVLSSTPVIAQVAQPRNVCNVEQVAVQQQKSGAGALMGAIAGGAMGNAVGGGGGKAAATMIGIMGGAIAGDNIEGAPAVQMQNVQRCHTQTFYENRTVAYNVVYEYANKQYSVQMPNDPGPTIQLQVSPVGVASQTAVPAPVTTSMNQPSYPIYVARPYYPAVSIDLGFGYWRGYGGHRHWR